MNESITNEVLKLLQGINQFTIGQAPEVIQQYISMQVNEHLGGILICFVLIMLSGVFILWMLSKKDSDYHPGIAVTAILIVLLSVVVSCEGMDYYNLTHNTKGYLLEKVISRGK
jgi:hypothetical protein